MVLVSGSLQLSCLRFHCLIEKVVHERQIYMIRGFMEFGISSSAEGLTLNAECMQDTKLSMAVCIARPSKVGGALLGSYYGFNLSWYWGSNSGGDESRVSDVQPARTSIRLSHGRGPCRIRILDDSTLVVLGLCVCMS